MKNLNLRLCLIWLLGLCVGGAAEPDRGTAPESFPDAETRVLRSLEKESLRIHFFKPEGWRAEEKRPALIFFFGGGWNQGTPERSASWARAAAKLGFVGIAPDYRTRNRHETSPAEAVADARLALRWVQERVQEFGIDPERIAVGGSSAGGHLALWTALRAQPPGSIAAEAPLWKPCALVLISPVTDTRELSGYAPERFGKLAQALSPLQRLDYPMPPVLVFHGDADKTVPLRHSVELKERLLENGARCELVVVPGGDHGFSSKLPDWKQRSRAQVEGFLKQVFASVTPTDSSVQLQRVGQSPRTWVLAGREGAFREYCLRGAGAKAFAKLRADYDRLYRGRPLPPEPLTYGDPAPSRRTTELADRWRGLQDLCGRVAGIAEAAALCWVVTGEDAYLQQAKHYLLGVAAWRFEPDWKQGPVFGATDIGYNDEAHFRLWRKLPQVYDQIRNQFTDAERQTILVAFRERGVRSFEWILREGAIDQVRPNSIEGKVSSHPVRFMTMTGLAGLALWDDLPEARQWWETARRFYSEQFPPWGGEDGGWAEGPLYWRGTFEHALFQDALFARGDGAAYSSPFWRNTPYFGVYQLQPYEHTIFGDTSQAGHFRLDAGAADFLRHVARVLGDGHLVSFASLNREEDVPPVERGLEELGIKYPTTAEYLLRAFLVADRSLPEALPLANLPKSRHFRDIGWVSMHSALGQPQEDIHLTFKSSPYGSYSHSHADQNAFIINAYGESLAINSSYREYHNSPHHSAWTRRTLSKNALLIDGEGQKPQSKAATGRITHFVQGPRFDWTRGDATKAYAEGLPGREVRCVERDIVFVDQRYFLVRDRVSLRWKARVSWLLHAEKQLDWNQAEATARIVGKQSQLQVCLLAPGRGFRGSVFTEFPLPPDPKYRKDDQYGDQAHLHVELEEPEAETEIVAVLWPQRGLLPVKGLKVSAEAPGAWLVDRPDGKQDRIRIGVDNIELK